MHLHAGAYPHEHLPPENGSGIMAGRGAVKHKAGKRRTGKLSVHAAANPRSNRLVVILSLVIVIGSLVGLEAFARLPAIQNMVQSRSLGFQHYFFEIKWFNFNKYFQRDNRMDFVFVGNSMVNTGVDIEAFDQAFENETGHLTRSFNFGLDGLNMTATSEVVKLLVDNYPIKVLLLGTELRDFAKTEEGTVSDVFTNTPWLEYRLGYFSPFGWLVDHSAFLQIFLKYRNWAQADYEEQYALIRHFWLQVTEAGYKGDTNFIDWSVPQPNFANPFELARKVLYKSFAFSDAKFEMLRELIEYCQSRGVVVFLLQMPVTKQFYQYFPDPEGDRQEYLARVKKVADETGVLFVESPDLNLITDEGWSNTNHMNVIGAGYYGKYLAHLLAASPNVRNILAIQDGQP
jgi:hypothetical protein